MHFQAANVLDKKKKNSEGARGSVSKLPSKVNDSYVCSYNHNAAVNCNHAHPPHLLQMVRGNFSITPSVPKNAGCDFL